MHLGKYRQHSLLTAIDQITSKPQRIMFLQREPLVPRWAPVKEVAKSQLTLLPNCKEPGCITLLAALSIPKEVFLSGVQAQPPPRAAQSGLQLGEACTATHGQGGPPGEDPARAAAASPLPATNTAPAGHVGVGVGATTSMPVCLRSSPQAGGRVDAGAAYSIVLTVTPRERHWPA